MSDDNALIERAETESLFSGKLLQQYQELDLSLLDLPRNLLEKRARPTMSMYKMKRNLWKEIAKAKKTGDTIKPKNIYNMVCSQGAYQSMISDPNKLAWMLQPVVSYEKEMEAVLDKATTRYEELLDMDITVTKAVKDPETKELVLVTETCPTKARALLAIIKQAEDRVKGMALQKQLNINTEKPEGTVESIDVDKVEERIRELEKKLGHGGQNDDIECTEAVLVETEESDDGEDSEE